MDKLLLTVSEVAFMLNCSDGYVYHLINTQKLTAVKRGNRYLIHIDCVKAYADLFAKQKRLNKH